jgi:ribosomal protein S18 acetylase RimI-like enzyme
MGRIVIIEREISNAELAQMHAGFNEHQLEHGNPIQAQLRNTIVATDDESFIGCSSGLRDNNWFYLSDLWVEKPYRRRGIGRRLLGELERRVASSEIRHIYTWTAGYEGPEFYKKAGYKVFCELGDYYPSGHSRVGMCKSLYGS